MTKASDNVFPRLLISEGGSTTTPAAGNVTVYAKADGLLYSKDDAGAETALGGGGGGAPTDAKYLVTAANGTLSAEIVIPGLGASPDIRVAGANDDEFDTTDTSDPMTGWTTLGSPTAHDINSTALSHYYVSRAANSATAWAGIYKAMSPAFTVTAKLSAVNLNANYNAAALFVGEATPGKMECLEAAYNTAAYGVQLEAFTNPTTYSSTPTTGPNRSGFSPVYLRIVVASSTDVSYYFSLNGMAWHLLNASRNPGFTVGSAGLVVKSESASQSCSAYFDWIRFS